LTGGGTSPEANIKNAYRMLPAEMDKHRGGKISMTEYMAIGKDKKIAEQKCSFRDIDEDGVITRRNTSNK